MEPTCSARFLGPILRILTAQGADRDLLQRDAWPDDPEQRVPLRAIYALLERARVSLGDEHLGLTLGAAMCLGETGPYDYVVRSAATVRDAIDVAGRYAPLHADGYRIALERRGERVLLRPSSEHAWPRVAAELSMASTYKLQMAERAPFGAALECWFPYPEPADRSAHARAFAGATLRFEAECYGFAFDRAFLHVPQRGADPVLHAQLRERLDLALTELAPEAQVKQRVRSTIEERIRRGDAPIATAIARSLRMSRRTLSRKLKEEGTSFAELFDDVRRDLALGYVAASERPLAEVAHLLGFSHVESFHRAFKRWTGDTPSAHRAGSTTQPRAMTSHASSCTI